MTPTAAPTRNRPRCILASVREMLRLVDVLDRNQALQSVFIVHQEQFLDLIFRQNLVPPLPAWCFPRRRDQIVFGHHLGEPLVVVGEKCADRVLLRIPCRYPPG